MSIRRMVMTDDRQTDHAMEKCVAVVRIICSGSNFDQ